MATSITRHNITWYFDGDYTVGQYPNEDWWVIGPVTIIDISPKSIIEPSETVVVGGQTVPRERNGSMINPGWSGPQGFDNSPGTGVMSYSRSVNVGLPNGSSISAGNPLVVQPGSSLISCRSQTLSTARPKILDMSILTVLASAPPAGSFRPPYHGSDKTHYWNTSQMDLSVLSSLPPPTDTPLLATLETLFEKFNFMMGGATGSDGRFISPINNQSSYAAWMACNRSLALNSLHLNYQVGPTNQYTKGTKNWLLIRMIQIGLDEYAGIAAGRTWRDSGALGIGHLGPMILAAKVLHDSSILAYCNHFNYPRFSEMRQIWFVTQADDVGRAVEEPTGSYIQADVGLAEWGEQHTFNRFRDSRYWTYTTTKNGGVRYRNICWDNVVAIAMFARLLGARNDLGHQAFFDYADRVMEIEGDNEDTKGGNRLTLSDSANNLIQAFTLSFHKAYRSLGDSGGGSVPEPAVTAPSISPDARAFLGAVEVSIQTPFPPGATVRYTTDGSDPTESSTLYTEPFIITETTQIKAKGFAVDYNSSPISSALFTSRYFTSTSNWTTILFQSQTGIAVPLSFSFTPSASSIDGVVGVGAIPADGYTDLAAIIQVATDGTVKARNSGTYTAVNTFNYSAGVKYLIDGTINTTAKTYSATITAPGGSPVVVATNYGYRTEQAAITELLYFSSVTAGSNSMVVEDAYVGAFTPPTPTVSIPVFSPPQGSYYNQAEIAITTSTPDSLIYYSLDGTSPLTGDSRILYTGPILSTGNTDIAAIAIKSGYNNSFDAGASYRINNFTATDDDWSNMSVGEWHNDVSLTFDATPSTGGIDAVFGFGPNEVSEYDNLAVNFRFSTGGYIEARNGNTYQSENSLPYTGNIKYSFSTVVDIDTKTYSTTVTPSGASPVVIATSYGFRTNQAAANKLGYASAILVSTGHSMLMENIRVALYNPIPVIERKFIKRQVLSRRRRR